MEISLLLKLIFGLIVLLGFLVFFLVLPARRKKRKKEELEKKKVELEEPKINFKELRVIIKNKNSTTEELKEALSLVIKHYGIMPAKLGLRSHPDSFLYLDIVFKICRHKNTNKDIIIKYTNDLEKLNPEYAKEINDALMKGLNSRGV